MGAFSACALAGLLALGGWERLQRDRAHRDIPVRIHVNGTRGKSTVTRMVAAALRASGRRVVAKSTGTAARIILPDGSEREVPRRSGPSIREQLWFLREARRLRADAIVVECMAIDPALQRVSELDMIASTLGIVTNTRPDHADVMGTTAAEVAAALAGTVPRGGVLVLGDVERPDLFEVAADERGCRIVRAAAPPLDDGTPAWVAENVGLALAATRELGLPDALATPAILAAPGDPGACRRYRIRVAAQDALAVDASAANDPDSLGRLLADVPRPRLFVFNHRGDRPTRLAQFAVSPTLSASGDDLLVTGDRPDWYTTRRLNRNRPGRAGFVPAATLARAIRTRAEGGIWCPAVVFCGNARGLDVPALVASLEHW